MNSDWKKRFVATYERGIAAWNDGRITAATMFDDQDAAFLAEIGYTTQELFDFIEDERRYGEPDLATALEVAEIRRDYFLNVLKGKPTGRTISMEELPAKTAEVDGLAWLPRLIEKARAKLCGEMPDDLMYGCGGDRSFLKKVKMTAPEFLRLTWESGNNGRRIIEAVKKSAGLK